MHRIRMLAHQTSAEFRRNAYREIGELLKEERERRGLGVRELARAAGVTPGNISAIEGGHLSSRGVLKLLLWTLEESDG